MTKPKQSTPLRNSMSVADDVFSDEASDKDIIAPRKKGTLSESSLSELEDNKDAAMDQSMDQEPDEEEDEEDMEGDEDEIDFDQDEEDEIDELEDEKDEFVDDVDFSDETDPRRQHLPKPKFKIKIASKTASQPSSTVDEESSDFSEGSETAPRAMTQRQRAKNEGTKMELLELPMEPGKKKILTAEEIALRRSETARKRKNQAEQKLQDQKQDTINRLLKKQATRRSTRDKGGEDDDSLSHMGRGSQSDRIHYISRADKLSTLSFSADYSLFENFRRLEYPPPKPGCDFTSCTKPMIYRSAKNGKVACSFLHLKSIEV